MTGTSALRELYSTEISSFLRYVVTVSDPPVYDDQDRAAQELFQRLYAVSETTIRDVAGVLMARDDALPEPHWPLVYTNYNFLQPRYLLGPLIERTRSTLGSVERAAARIDAGSDPDAEALARAAVGRWRDALAELQTAASSASPPHHVAAPKKGTSASRW